MNYISASLVTLLGVLIIIFLKEVKPDYIVPLSVVLGGVIIIQIIPSLMEIFGFTEGLISKAISTAHISTLYKALSSAFLCQYVIDICKESGVEFLASKLEFFCKVYITVLCLPLVEEFIKGISEF